ncbi:MAG: Eco57I restriction-modification methylase domain-containing protein [Actinomycetota bacterium]|jgi:adenine-specific DNA-methyltransferase|nr:Eco57I restriction-modification methylase domain-containing protein [Actinomycetota bacterium]
MTTQAPLLPATLVDRSEARRVSAAEKLEDVRRDELGQFFTPAPIANLLAGMFDPSEGALRLLDAGAGVGSLTAALVARAGLEQWPASVDAHVVEVDQDLLPTLTETMHECEAALPRLSSQIHGGDFIEWGCEQLGLGLFAGESTRFELAILNPPYRKLNTASRERRLLAEVGIQATNLYSAFVALALRLLAPHGQLVAITPRSFCNGPYFKAFRREMFATSALRRIHVFDSRNKAFRDSEVLQENVIVHLVKGDNQGDVVIASSDGSGEESVSERRVPFSSVVHPGDANCFIHVSRMRLTAAWRRASVRSPTGSEESMSQCRREESSTSAHVTICA